MANNPTRLAMRSRRRRRGKRRSRRRRRRSAGDGEESSENHLFYGRQYFCMHSARVREMERVPWSEVSGERAGRVRERVRQRERASKDVNHVELCDVLISEPPKCHVRICSARNAQEFTEATGERGGVAYCPRCCCCCQLALLLLRCCNFAVFFTFFACFVVL